MPAMWENSSNQLFAHRKLRIVNGVGQYEYMHAHVEQAMELSSLLSSMNRLNRDESNFQAVTYSFVTQVKL